jgi:hypothetical protein
MSNESFSLAMTRRGDGNIGDLAAVAFVTELVTASLIWRYRNWTRVETASLISASKVRGPHRLIAKGSAENYRSCGSLTRELVASG